jgi:hypothetical protein
MSNYISFEPKWQKRQLFAASKACKSSKSLNLGEIMIILIAFIPSAAIVSTQYFSNNSIDSLTRVPKPFKSVSEKLGKILNLEVLS